MIGNEVFRDPGRLVISITNAIAVNIKHNAAIIFILAQCGLMLFGQAISVIHPIRSRILITKITIMDNQMAYIDIRGSFAVYSSVFRVEFLNLPGIRKYH
jgi:hypothetical protein